MHFERNGGKSEAVRKDDTTEKKDDDTEDIYHWLRIEESISVINFTGMVIRNEWQQEEEWEERAKGWGLYRSQYGNLRKSIKNELHLSAVPFLL